jgi:hypothetical protein
MYSCLLQVWGLAAVLRVPPANIQSLFVRQPLLLNLSADTLSRKASSLHSNLELPPQQLWEMLHCKPGVLLFSSAKVARKWTALKRTAGGQCRGNVLVCCRRPALGHAACMCSPNANSGVLCGHSCMALAGLITTYVQDSTTASIRLCLGSCVNFRPLVGSAASGHHSC